MEKIIFTYDPDLTEKHGHFTVILTPAVKSGQNWLKSKGSKIFFVRDLSHVATRVPDRDLFKTALESEMDIRKTEGRFFSQNEEFTRLRIANRHVFTFITGCQKKRILVYPDGICTRFRIHKDCLPEIRVLKDQLNLFIEGQSFSGQELLLTAMPLTLIHSDTIVQLAIGVTHRFLKGIPINRKTSEKERNNLLLEYARHPDKLTLGSTGKNLKKILKNIMPKAILDFGETLKKAQLFFIYEDVQIKDTDLRNPVYDLKQNLEIHRNILQETKICDLLSSLGFFSRPDESFNWFLSLQSIETVLPVLGQEGITVRLNNRAFSQTVAVTWKIASDPAHICVGGRVISGDFEMGIGPLCHAFRENQSWFKRPDGSYGLMGEELKKLFSQLAQHGKFKGGDITFNRSDFSYVGSLFEAYDDLETDQGYKDLYTFAKQYEGIRRYTVPEALTQVLRPYQVLGFNWLRTLRDLGLNGILADDMGLGKSLQVLCLIKSLKGESRLGGPVLLVAPKTLIFNWELEIKKFSPDLSYYVFAGTGRSRDPDFLNEHEIILSSYGLLRTEITLFCSINWDSVILDEAHAIKNPFALVSRAVKKIPCKTRLTITGTPVENSPSDLWSQFDFLMPGFLHGLKSFNATYGTDTKKLTELRIKTKPYILRRLKSQVLAELPPKTDMTIFCDFTKDQLAVYEEALISARRDMADMQGKSSFKMLSLILRLRLIACHPDLAVKKGHRSFDSGKLQAVLHSAMEILAEGHKILIFSQFTRHLKLVETQFRRQKIATFYLDGKTPDRGKVVQAFQGHRGPCPFFISLKTGGTGLNLSEANYVFLLDPWWNPAVENQAIDRCHRMGQKQAVTVYRFITKGSIEEKVNALKQVKKNIEETLINESIPTMLPYDAETLTTILMSDN
ncbi:MAG: DEAD/DEAH box helicase [Proteobacteria bacterium]|nr:DEAD/DEAH box helicase [Pseudomonadota bacterium]